MHDLATRHGVQSKEFLDASVAYFKQFPQQMHVGPNAHHRDIEARLISAEPSLQRLERVIAEIESNESLSVEDRKQEVEMLQPELDKLTATRDRWLTQWGKEFSSPVKENKTPLKLAQTLFDRMTKTEDFLMNALQEYDSVMAAEARPSFQAHIAKLREEGGNPNPKEILTEWAKGRIDQKSMYGQFDFTAMKDIGLDTELFIDYDAQHERDDTEQANMAGRFGRAWLKAAHLVYDQRNGRSGGVARYIESSV